jgi:hypothetical protein
LAETELVISAFADSLKVAGAAEPARHLQALARLLREFPEQTMAELLARWRLKQHQPKTEQAHKGALLIKDVVPHLEALKQVLDAGRATPPLVSDLALLIDLLRASHERGGDSRYLSPMLSALRQAFMPNKVEPAKPEKEIREFIGRLRAETGSDKFDQVLSELANSKLKREHIVEVARAVYGGLPKKVSRRAALTYIRKPHDAYMSAKRGIEATGGRSAA